MIKMYHREANHGGSASFWSENWRDRGLDEALAFCRVDPLAPIFRQYVQRGDRLLEGGCGLGQYVVHHDSQGVNVVGLDFAQDPLSRLRSRFDKIRLSIGDVARLPFCDGVFDVYYSGGVVEHFEGGAEKALAEARRVLRPGGRFLVSVPYLSPLRRAVSVFKSDRRWVCGCEVESRSGDYEKWNFFQYAFGVREFQRMLRDAGFTVVSTHGYAIMWGLSELPLVARLLAQGVRLRQAGKGNREGGVNNAVKNGRLAHDRASLMKRVFVCEDDTIPIVGSGLRAARWAFANMMMYVCIR